MFRRIAGGRRFWAVCCGVSRPGSLSGSAVIRASDHVDAGCLLREGLQSRKMVIRSSIEGGSDFVVWFFVCLVFVNYTAFNLVSVFSFRLDGNVCSFIAGTLCA